MKKGLYRGSQSLIRRKVSGFYARFCATRVTNSVFIFKVAETADTKATELFVGTQY